MSKELEEFKSKCDIAKVVSHYVSLEKAGTNYRGLCPFHEEKTPSFYVNVEKGFFHCFGCGAGGDVIEFVKRIENISFVEAVQRVAELCDVEPPAMSRDTLYTKYTALMAKITKNYTKTLLSVRGKKGLEYLTKVRGITREDIEKFELGYAPANSDVIVKSARESGIEIDFLLKYGLIFRSKSGRIIEFFRNRIIFPVKNSSGKTVAFGGRALGEQEPKYLNSSENKYFSKSKTLYLFKRDKVKKAGFVILCEGYMDAIAFHKNGFENAAAVLGVGLTKEHVNLLKNATNNVLMILDNDAAGINAVKRAAKIFASEELNVKVLILEGVKDPDEFFLKRGKNEFAHALRNAVDYWDFYVQKSVGEINDLPRAIQRLKRSLEILNSKVLKKILVSKAAKLLMMEEKDLFYELGHKERMPEKIPEPFHQIKMGVDDYVIYLLFLSEETRRNLRPYLEDVPLSALAKKVLKFVDEGITNAQEVMKLLEQSESKRFFQIFTQKIPKESVENLYEFCVTSLEKRRLKHQIEKLEKEMVSTSDENVKSELMRKAMELRSRLKRKGGASRG